MKKYLLFAAAALALAACSNEENLTDNDPNTPVEIRLTSGIEVQTRATHNLDEWLKNGEQVRVWVDDAGQVADKGLYTDNVLTAGNSGSLTGDVPMYFPSTGNAINIYAVHGNYLSDAFWGQTVTHTVATDQQTGLGTDGYALSDLVYAQSVDIARTKNSIPLKFKHLLSKVEVVLVKGAGSPDIEKVEILNTKLEAQFTPNKENPFSVTPSGTITDENPIVIDSGTTEKAVAEQSDTDNDKVLNEAIIVPQELKADTEFIRVTTVAGGVLIYKLPTDQASRKFEPGKKYRYTITANLTGLTVTATIDGWGSGSDNSGEAVMQ